MRFHSSKEKRPEWDKKVLEKLGMRMVEVIEDIGLVQDPRTGSGTVRIIPYDSGGKAGNG